MNTKLDDEINGFKDFRPIKTKNMNMLRILGELDDVAIGDKNVLLIGGPGSGRDTFANIIHNRSLRCNDGFHKIQCKGASVEEMKLNPAGTYYFDRVEHLTVKAQHRLMEEIDCVPNARIISCSSQKLNDKLDGGKFYKKLYYRLCERTITLPSLQSRREDITDLTREFIRYYNWVYDKDVTIEKGALNLLKYYRFPGNITELRNIIDRAVLVCRGKAIKTNSIMSILDMENVVFQSLVSDSPLSLKSEVDRLERNMIETAIANQGSMTKAAALLDIDVSTISRKCKQLGIVVVTEN